MRVLLATGIFYPDVGGPATHVRKMAEHFSSLGWDVTVVAFGDMESESLPYKVFRTSRTLPKVMSWLLYSLRILRHAASNDVVYAFDLTTSGIPAALAASLCRRKFIVRIGGDPIWEREAEAGRRLIPMNEYYEKKLYKSDRPVLYAALHLIIKRADRIVVYNERFKDFYIRYFSAKPENITVVRNPVLSKEQSVREKDTRTIIFAGRFVAYKNLERVIRAAARAFSSYPQARLLFVGDGPERGSLERLAKELHVPLIIRSKADQKALFEMIRSSSIAIAPALSEFNPNFVLESLSLGKPVLISKDHGLSVDVPVSMEFDPMSVESMAQALVTMLSDEEYAKAEVIVAAMPLDWTWRDVLRVQEEIVSTIV